MEQLSLIAFHPKAFLEMSPQDAPRAMGQHPAAWALAVPFPSQPFPHGASRSWTAYKTTGVFWEVYPSWG